MLSDLQHTLAGQGIAVCSGDVHPDGAPLATLAISLQPESKATVDIEVRDAVTHKRVTRDVDLTPIPADGHAVAIAIEADELLRASWAEVALDTARARQAQARPQVVGSVDQVLAPSRMDGAGALGARGAVEHYLGGVTLLGLDAFGRLAAVAALADGDRRRHPRRPVDAGAARAGQRARRRAAAWICWSGWRAATAASLATGAGVSASWLQFRAEPAPGAEGAAYANLLAVARLRLVGRLALGQSLHAAAGIDGGIVLRGVEATDAGQVVAQATGFALGASLGLEAP